MIGFRASLLVCGMSSDRVERISFLLGLFCPANPEMKFSRSDLIVSDSSLIGLWRLAAELLNSSSRSRSLSLSSSFFSLGVTFTTALSGETEITLAFSMSVLVSSTGSARGGWLNGG